jgi:hypothetical protein
MSLPYDPDFDWQTNIDDLASKLESVLRERSKTRETIAPYPSTNIPNLIEHNDAVLKSFDRETEIIQYQASAAREGYLWFDPETLRTPTVALDGEAMEWRKQAAKRGKIVRPEEYFESRHTAINEPPLMVRRGGVDGVAAPVLWK